MIDAISFVLGKNQGRRVVELDGDMTYTDDGNGNITITEEANDNG